MALSFPYKIRFLLAHDDFYTTLWLGLKPECAFSHVDDRWVYLQQKDQSYQFCRLPHPTRQELQQIINKIKSKIENKLKKTKNDNQLNFDEESTHDISKLSIEHTAAFGERKGHKLRRYGINSQEVEPENPDPTTSEKN